MARSIEVPLRGIADEVSVYYRNFAFFVDQNESKLKKPNCCLKFCDQNLLINSGN